MHRSPPKQRVEADPEPAKQPVPEQQSAHRDIRGLEKNLVVTVPVSAQQSIPRVYPAMPLNCVIAEKIKDDAIHLRAPFKSRFDKHNPS
ncbi:MAG: hypothetical protein L3J98_09070 [Gammaproteobacteria bacterium]|nr:hypothetical protein [Gammaproteobacteria bacterium]MCF6260292.1 hypothetical protein [Gammaproteobacteria bacterium]